MYQPALRPEQVKALYYLNIKVHRLMTQLLREALDQYLEGHGGTAALIPEDEHPAHRK